VAFGPRALFLAAESEGPYAAWFLLAGERAIEALGEDVAPAVALGRGAVLEGTIDLEAAFGGVPSRLYLAAGAWATGDRGALWPSSQAPPSLDGNGDVDAAEVLALDPTTLEAP
jgi:hypothetical protein